MKYLIVTGLSGAGKTACVRYLEDKGSFCMDNIPPMMLPKLLEAFDTTRTRWETVTIAVDARSGEFFDAYAVAQMIRELSRVGHSMETIFMEASDETLLDRYKETRRDHPLCQEGLTLTQAIAEERLRLQPLRETADYVIDTTGLTSRAMKKKLDECLGKLNDEEPPIRAEVMSFGFKRGLPRQADIVIDGVVYKEVDGKMTVTGYTGSASSVTVQETVEGKTVTVIGESAFENNTTITHVDLPDTIQVIGKRAFAGCTSLSNMD